MKRSDIILNHDHYLNTLRRLMKMQTDEDASLVRAQIMDRDAANRNWAVLFDFQNLLILMKRANVTVAELEEWVKDASNIRKISGQAEPEQQKLF